MPQLYHLLKMISQGDVALARQELTSILRSDPNNTEAWSLMALAVVDPAQKAECYRQVLKQDPNNENARTQLEALKARLAAGEMPAMQPDAGSMAGAPPLASQTATSTFPPANPAPAVASPRPTASAAQPINPPGTLGLIPSGKLPAQTPDWLAELPIAEPPPAAAPVTATRDFPKEAFEHIAEGRVQQALRVIEEGLVVQPKDPTLWKLYSETGEAEYVKKQAKRFLTLDPANIAAQQVIDRLKAKPKLPVRKDSCVEQIVYLIAGIGIIGILELVIVIISAATGANVFSDSGEYPQTALGAAGYCCAGLVAFFSLGLWITLGVAGWDSDLNPMIKGAIVFIAMVTPLGWYWIGRGGVRLTRSWLTADETPTAGAT